MKKSELKAMGQNASAIGRGEKRAARVTRLELMTDGGITETEVDAELFRKTLSTEWNAKTQAGKIRQTLGMTQPEFAKLLGIPVATLRKWEIGPTQPSGAARTLLLLAAEHPDLVKEASCRAVGAS